MGVHFMQNSFNGGIWSPSMEGRTELAKYPSALYRMENFLIDPRGPAVFRPGFRYINGAKFHNKASRLIPFEFSTTQAYQLEFGDGYIRFFRDQAIITKTAQAITGISKANPAVITYDGADTYANTERCVVAGVSGMVEINNREVTVANLNAGANTFECSGLDSTGFTAWSAGGTIAEIYEITSPYAEADLPDIKYCQSADVLYLWHPDYAPRKLSRTAHTSWTLSTINFQPPAVKEQGKSPAATLTLAAVTGLNIQVDLSAGGFLDGDVGRVIQSGVGRASIIAFNSATQVHVDIIDDFADVGPIAAGSWTILGSPVGDITPSALGPVGSICTVVSTAAAPNLFIAGDVGKYILVHDGYIKITAYTSATQVSGQILKELSAVTATASWTLESTAWNATDGYPSCGTFYEERLCVAASPAYPETVWGSAVGDYESHLRGVADADAFEFTLTGKEVSIIQWIEPDEYLLIGSVGKISRLGPQDTGKALTPTNVVAKRQSPDGAANIMPVAAGNAVLYVQRTGFDGEAGLKIGELTWSWEKEKYVTPDMLLLADSVARPGIAGIAYQLQPNSVLWAYRTDGGLLSFTYLREQDVAGWAEHPIDGEVESVSVIPGDGYGEVWAVIKRTINGATVRNVEMMAAIFTDSAATYVTNKGLNAFFVDCGLTYNGVPATVISGLAHLEGETVAVLADGGYAGTTTVTNSKITLRTAASVVHVGLPYDGILQKMRPEIPMRDGTAQGRTKKVNELNVRVYCSGPFEVGPDTNNLDTCEDKERDVILGDPYPLFTGDLPIGYDESYNKDARIMIVQDKPMPLTVVAIMPEMSVS